MNRSIGIVLSVGLSFVAMPALAQQPIYPPNDSQYGSQPQQVQPQYDPYQQQQQQQMQQPVDPYAQYGNDDDDEEGYDVTYDVSTQEQPYDDGYDPNAYSQFESTLSPYGAWSDVPSYGHVWIPSTSVVGVDFSPYGTGGHFAMTEYGWTWVSDYDWGWAPFHYGRWMVVGGYGWCWTPGTTWGPAWVDWRFGGGYAGWAPMAPRGVVIGPPRGVRSPWRFTLAAQLGAQRPAFLPSRAVAQVWGRTNAINNVARVNVGGAMVHVNAGPSAQLVAQAVGHPVATVPLHSVAPRALPQASIQARVGTPVSSRPWMQSRPIGGSFSHTVPGAHTIGNVPVQSRPQPMYHAPQPYAQPQYRAPQSVYHAPQPYAQPQYRAPQPYAQPQYRAPQPMYHAPQPYAQPQYRAPQPMYHAPQPMYQQPQYHYSAPQPSYHYSAPQPSFHYSAPSPSYHYSAPSQSFHSSPAPSFHGGGSFGGGARGGGFHR
jgi:uncharacterized protein DUF6600